MKIFTIIILKIILFYSTFVSAEVKIAALYAESGPVSEIAESIAEAKRVAVETINPKIIIKFINIFDKNAFWRIGYKSTTIIKTNKRKKEALIM